MINPITLGHNSKDDAILHQHDPWNRSSESSTTKCRSQPHLVPAPSSVRTHRRPSIPLRLGPLPSECYTTVSTLTCRYTLPCNIILFWAYLNRRQNVDPHFRTSIPLRLGPLPSECYTTTSMRTHHRASIPLRLGPILSECYFMAIHMNVGILSIQEYNL